MPDQETTSAQATAHQIEAAIADLFAVQDVTLGVPGQPQMIRLRGYLQVPPHQAYAQIAARLQSLGYVAVLRRDPQARLDVLLAQPGALPRTGQPRYWLHGLLLGATVLTTLYAGAGMVDTRPPDDLWWPLFHLWQGWPFALSLLSILLAHELGHYFVSRHHGVDRSLPYFIPLPLPDFMGNVLGTLGAVILMKAPVTNRRVMLDIGAAGPVAGLLVAVPVLWIGLSLSHIQALPVDQIYSMEGNSLLYLLLKYLVFGRWLPGGGVDVFIHPVAFAGWAGLLVTSFNLIPAGQFDGGHIVYSIFGTHARRFTWPIILVLAFLALLVWPGWLMWAFLVFFLGQGHPAPLDEITRLDARRKVLAVAMLALLLLTFTPIPMVYIVPPGVEEPLSRAPLVAAAAVACLTCARRLLR